eukprot:347234-Chlamydomonas_euryale.AAC.1
MRPTHQPANHPKNAVHPPTCAVPNVRKPQGASVCAMRSGASVGNFPLAPVDSAALRRVLTLRRVELADPGGGSLDIRGTLLGAGGGDSRADGLSPRTAATSPALSAAPSMKQAAGAAAGGPNLAAELSAGGTSFGGASFGGAGVPGGVSFDDELPLGPGDDLSGYLYDDLELRGTMRRRAQAMMLTHMAWQVRAWWGSHNWLGQGAGQEGS